MKEKVMCVKLPEGAKYRRVIVTDDRNIEIVYSEECKCKGECQRERENIMAKVEIAKPKALVGGSAVYQKDDLPYWFCKIKNGRDEFMHVPMEDLTENDLLFDSKTGRLRIFVTDEQKKFVKEVFEALDNKPTEGFRWIPVFEPSSTLNGEVQFVKGHEPLLGYTSHEWKNILEGYSVENESGMSSKTTYFLLLLRWLKDGVVNLEEIADDSKYIGHYINSKNTKDNFELTGERGFGGLYGFAGNTCKIVVDYNLGEPYFSILGGYHKGLGNRYPLADVYSLKNMYSKAKHTVGLMELKK